MASEVQSATARHCPGRAWTGGVQGNQRPVALTGIVLPTLLIVEVLTVPSGVRNVTPLPRTSMGTVQDLRTAWAAGAGGGFGSIARPELITGSALLGPALAAAAIPLTASWLHL